jgi:hypothetical protein
VQSRLLLFSLSRDVDSCFYSSVLILSTRAHFPLNCLFCLFQLKALCPSLRRFLLCESHVTLHHTESVLISRLGFCYSCSANNFLLSFTLFISQSTFWNVFFIALIHSIFSILTLLEVHFCTFRSSSDHTGLLF